MAARDGDRILHQHPEPVDAEPLGKSVRAARERLGMNRQARASQESGPVADPSSVDLSLSDVELVGDSQPPISVQTSEPLRGLWSDEDDADDGKALPDRSASFELVRKKP
ncbi:MAG: hypothetical protein KF729_07815 [Sandaracinaceae bacterium]|nr:hypothetical protein [Sandaracinaceae bacterium]